MSNTDKYVTMAKYSTVDKETSDTTNMIEEERRSKAYSKIIGSGISRFIDFKIAIFIENR